MGVPPVCRVLYSICAALTPQKTCFPLRAQGVSAQTLTTTGGLSEGLSERLRPTGTRGWMICSDTLTTNFSYMLHKIFSLPLSPPSLYFFLPVCIERLSECQS